MDTTLPNPDLTKSLIPRSLHPQRPIPEDAPPVSEPEPYKLTAVDEPGVPVAEASAENEPNTTLEMVEQTVMDDAVRKKVPNDERSHVGDVKPLIS